MREFTHTSLILAIILFVLSWLSGSQFLGILAVILMVPISIAVLGALCWQLINR